MTKETHDLSINYLSEHQRLQMCAWTEHELKRMIFENDVFPDQICYSAWKYQGICNHQIVARIMTGTLHSDHFQTW